MEKGSQSVPSLSVSLVRNTAYNLISQGIFVVLALWAIPILLRGLGQDQFGLFALVWGLIGYFSLLDFGISRANTKFLSEAVAKNDVDEIPKIVWTSLTSTFLLGVLSSVVIILSAPFIVDLIFKTNVNLRYEALRYFRIAGFGIPFLIVFGTLKGFQMALHRFDIVNIFQTLTGIIQWGGSVILLYLGYGLEEIVLLSVGVRILFAVVTFGMLPQLIPNIFMNILLIDRATAKKLFSFGGWVTVSQVVSPLFLYLDRMFIGIFLPLSAVTYYSVPQEALTRVLVLTISFTATLFPVMSGQTVLVDGENRLGFLYERSLKYIAIIMIPLIIGFVIFAYDIVQLWLGAEFAHQSVLVFQILAVGLFFNSLAQLPTTLLHAVGRPDLTAKFHLIELPVMVTLNLILIPIIGIVGAAIAWSLRVILDTVMLFYSSRRFAKGVSVLNGLGFAKDKLLIFSLIAIVILILLFFISNQSAKIIITGLFAIFYIVVMWLYIFDERDRAFFVQIRYKIFG